CVLLPVGEQPLHHLAILRAIVGKAGVGSQVGPQPVEGLLTEAGTVLVVQVAGVRAGSPSGQGGSARSAVAILGFQIIRHLRVRGESLSEESDRGVITLFELSTEPGKFDLLLWAAQLQLSREDVGELLVQGEQTFDSAKVVADERVV